MSYPLALSVCQSYVVCRLCPPCLLEDIKSVFGANVHHVPGLCLLGIGGTPYLSHKIMAQKPYFHIFDFSETTRRWQFMLCQKSLNVGLYIMTLIKYKQNVFAHLWSAYAIPLCPSVVDCTPCSRWCLCQP